MAFCIAQARGRRTFFRALAGVAFVACLAGLAGICWAPAALANPVEANSAGAAASAARPASPWVGVPRLTGRLQAADLGLVINTADPYSVAVGEHYIRRRGLTEAQVLRLRLPPGPSLSREDFERLREGIAARFDTSIQALALAWVAPYAVECNAITGALAMGFDAELCKQSCGVSRTSTYFNSASLRPLADMGWRPSMLLAAPNVEQARALIDRGVLSDGALAQLARPTAHALLLTTDDAARGVRRLIYPPAGSLPGTGVAVRIEAAADLAAARRVFLVITGSATIHQPQAIDWLPGGLGDHLTSFGGALLGETGQSTALDWIAGGATASHGTVSEPCNHLQKFPHPQVLLLHYLQGATALEAYWKSVAWPQQALFVGEPLAAPFALPPSAVLAAAAAATAAAASATVPAPNTAAAVKAELEPTEPPAPP